jgi:hypothetical protein
MLPVWPVVESSTVTLAVCAREGIEKEHEPLIVVAVGQGGTTSLVQDPPLYVTEPLVQIAVMLPV